MKWWPALVTLVALAPVGVSAVAWADAKIILESSTAKMSVEDEIRVTARASGSFDQMSELSADGFDFRQAGHQQQLSVIGRQMQQTESLLYIGTPQRPGKFTIGPLVLLQDGKIVAKSEVLHVEVTAVQEELSSGPAEKLTDLSQYAGQPFFVHPTLSVVQPFVGQPFVVTYALYWTRQRTVAGIRATSEPKYDKLEPENLLGQNAEKGEPVFLGGQPYQRQITHRDLLVSGTPGTLRLGGPRFRVDTLEGRAQRVSPPTMLVQVRPLPTEGVPPGFLAGNVGRLRLTGTLQSTNPQNVPAAGRPLTVQTGERALLTLTVQGDGNLYGVKPPELPTLPGMHAQVVPNRDAEGVQKTAAGVQGRRTWQWMLTFDQPGKVEFPALPWASFDPTVEKYEAQNVGPFDVLVQGQAVQPLAADATTTDDPMHKRGQRAQDVLRPLATQATLSAPPSRPWTDGGLYRNLARAPWLLLVAVLALAWRKRRQAAEQPAKARANALPATIQQLTAAKALAPGQGYAQLKSAVAAYIERVAGLSSGGLTEQAMVEALVTRQVPVDLARDLAADVQHCDFARFAPAGDRQADLAQTADRLTQHLTRLDDLWRQRPPTRVLAGVALVLLATAVIPCEPAWAGTLDQTLQQANAAYAAADYKTAVKLYQSLVVHDLAAPAVQYNLGNAYVHLHQPGRAIAAYQTALRMGPDAKLEQDTLLNLNAVRAELTDNARRHHATLHVFDESAALDVLLSEHAPRGLLGALTVLAGWLAVALLAWWLLGQTRPRWVAPVAIALGVIHVLAGSFLAWADHTRDTVVRAIVIEEDAQLTSCVPDGDDDLGLPEGMEVRRLGEMADGRVQVRLPNGREGCVAPTAVLVQGPAAGTTP